MNRKCSITGEPCNIDFYTMPEDNRSNCPIGRYKDSSYRYAPGESKSGAVWRSDDECRYHGIARARRLREKEFIIG
jgi:hypothetical protein